MVKKKVGKILRNKSKPVKKIVRKKILRNKSKPVKKIVRKKILRNKSKPVKKIVRENILRKDRGVVNRIVPKNDKRGFFSKLFGISGKDELDNHLPHPQRKSLDLIKKKENNILKKVKKSKIHPEIAKKLKKIDELKEIHKINHKVNVRIGKESKEVIAKTNKQVITKTNKQVITKTGKESKDSKVTKTKDPTIVTKDGAEFLKTFVPGFDELLDPGIPKGAAVLVEGGPGSGKTLMCLTMLSELCKRGKKVLFMSFEEPEERLRQHIDSFGLDAKEYEKKGLLYLKRFNALDIARSVEALLSEAKKELLIDVQPVLIPKDFQPDVVVLDSLSSISSAFSGEASRFRIYMEQLFRYLEGHNINSFLIREVASPTHIGGTFVEQGEAVSFLSDGIVAIYNVIYDDNPRKRAIEVLKMRGVNADRRLCEYEIKEHGVIIHSNKTLKGKYKLT